MSISDMPGWIVPLILFIPLIFLIIQGENRKKQVRILEKELQKTKKTLQNQIDNENRDLQEKNKQLKLEIHERTCTETTVKKNEEALKLAFDELETRVQERTQELKNSNTLLQAEKEKAEEATKLKDTFVSLVAHDLRSPLSSIVGLLEFMLDDQDHPLSEGQKALVGDIMSSGRNITKMIEDILNISRLKTGKIQPKKMFFDGYFLIDEVLQRISHPISIKQLSVENSVPKYTRLFGDPTLFGAVVQNLMTNAIKFSYPGSKIRLFIPEEEKTAIAVQDYGQGIPEDIQLKLFNVDEKTSTPGTSGEQGTGFGLPFSFDIMEAHGGQLMVSSIPGQGSLFTAKLPFVRPRILLVDDQEMDRILLSTVLERLELDIFEAKDGHSALTLLDEKSPHLLISDITMPGMDGFELLKQVKIRDTSDFIPVILITGDDKTETRDRAFRLGASDFTVKPIVIHDFLPRVRHQLGC